MNHDENCDGKGSNGGYCDNSWVTMQLYLSFVGSGTSCDSHTLTQALSCPYMLLNTPPDLTTLLNLTKYNLLRNCLSPHRCCHLFFLVTGIQSSFEVFPTRLFRCSPDLPWFHLSANCPLLQNHILGDIMLPVVQTIMLCNALPGSFCRDLFLFSKNFCLTTLCSHQALHRPDPDHSLSNRALPIRRLVWQYTRTMTDDLRLLQILVQYPLVRLIRLPQPDLAVHVVTYTFHCDPRQCLLVTVCESIV